LRSLELDNVKHTTEDKYLSTAIIQSYRNIDCTATP
jgi:hypothetical protein